jgi:hypothetical protein
MTDWKAIARARRLEIPNDALDRIADPLNALETAMRPLLDSVPPEVEPAVAFRAAEDAE